ncbi:hypothetical protein MCBMB27_00937 [Methylobacterium phyllosphaerae]|uniref:CobQ/CobB/MinD/ParA nucleotide binding domain-containing protein n=1 Tax=Methylobacterium phyllosphaerae TaxID=418223 RepID=A0AAE8HPK0_9HYPH|nr:MULTISPECIES: division plane positioning ATPase MipZ [Methylobacterium]APT30228.1 hypothetical protein MCBMB27_00937 [Methylobacterium phyllosphaerae]SFG53396.1 CobQ/CobB/MinD/ParA nucleotide binding domain-containing protein [Methylobacterium phyllosphaerae]
MTQQTDDVPPPLYTTDKIDELRARLLGPTAERALVVVLGGKGGVGKTTSALEIADLLASVGQILAIDADLANEHFFKYFTREVLPGKREPSRTGIRPIQHRLRAEDHAGRIDPTACQDMMAVIGEAPEPFVIIDFPAGDTDTTKRCTEIIVEECRENHIRLIVVVIVGPVDPTPLKVLPSLMPLLRDCDRSVLAKNTHTGINFEYLEASEIYQQLQAQPSIRITEIEPIGERINEALRVHNVSWEFLATSTPMRIRVEARRLRRNFHGMWLEAISHDAV